MPLCLQQPFQTSIAASDRSSLYFAVELEASPGRSGVASLRPAGFVGKASADRFAPSISKTLACVPGSGFAAQVGRRTPQGFLRGG